ncbi:MAG TPA: DNA polymerase III subunit gamma/tau [Ktedonobacterales bacterium]|nr:DNA polymerase III subunit gamma/tau [Ktedonobacterales bacterium]
MASQSLYRKWRSQTFSDLIGQEAVTRTLLNAVRDGRLAHAYLFCGPRGTGKTSAARLLAKAVNCATPHNGEPCNECLSCREITAGHSPDVIEIDAASNTGVDNIRDLRENVALMSSGGHYRMFIVDECHMLSPQAFNALLKTLEEPPPHVIFVLATTEAHKVLATVVSRCQRFDFRRHTMRNIVARLDHIAQGEGLALDPAAAELLARSAQGGMRDALSLLDQAVAFCGDQITYAGVRGMLGLADAAALRTLIAHVAARHAAEGLDLINDLVASGADLRQLNAQLIEEWRALMLARAGADVARLMDRTDDDAREIAALATQFTLDQLMACARIFTRNEGPARGLPIPQLALELVFLECVSVCDPTRPAAIVEATLAPHISPALPAAASAHTTPSAAYTPNTPAASATAYTPAYTPATPSAPSTAQTARPQPAAPAMRATSPTPPVATLDLASIDRGGATSASITPTSPAAPVQAGATPATHGADDIANDEWGDTSDYDDPGAWDEAVGDMPAVAPTVAPATAPAVYDEPADDVDEPAASAAPAVRQQATPAPGRDWLTEAQNHWTLVKKICKQRPGQGATVGALLSHAYPILMEPEQSGEPPTIILQAKYKFHADGLRDPAKREIIEWALEQALETPVRVRVVQEGAAMGPGVTIGRGATPPASSASSAPINSAAYAAPRATTPPAQDHLESAERSGQRIVREGRDGYAPTSNGQNGYSAQNGHDGHGAHNGHGRNGAAGQGAQATPAAPSQRALEEQARADPVVQELARLLGAEVAEVRSLDAPDDDEPS